MHRNENATGYLTRLQNYSHKAKQAGAHISAERFQKVLFSQMKKNPNPTYRSKAESLETRAQLDNQPIPTTVLEHIFFSLDGVQAREATYKNTHSDNRHPKRDFPATRHPKRDPPRHQPQQQNNSPRGSYSANKATIATMRSKQGQISKTYKFCVYCYKKGHDESNCPDKKSGKPPSKPEWTNNIRCHACHQVGHLAFNCPPKYKCGVARTSISTLKQHHPKPPSTPTATSNPSTFPNSTTTTS